MPDFRTPFMKKYHLMGDELMTDKVTDAQLTIAIDLYERGLTPLWMDANKLKSALSELRELRRGGDS